MKQGLMLQHSQLHSTLGKMELALGVIRECIVWTNEAGIIQWCNGSFDRLVNKPHIELLGKKLVKILPQAGHSIQEVIKNVRHAGIYEYECPNGILNLEITSNSFEIAKNEKCIISVIRDITEFSQALMDADHFSKEAEKANQLKSKFLANMSHELRTPLNAIIGFTELMHDEMVGPVSDIHKEYLKDVLSSAQHLLHLINDILDISKIESGKVEFYPEDINLDQLCHEVKDVLQPLISKKNMQVMLKIDRTLTNIVTDPYKLKQILYNYLSNALKFTKHGGKINLNIFPYNTMYFRLEVIDNGVGIKKSDIDKLFTDFQQLDAADQKNDQGTGLGLALTRRIVEAQGGTVGVISTPGEGSTFFALLPRIYKNTRPSSPIIEHESVHQDKLSRNNPKSILVIESDSSDAEIVKNTLTEAGYRVTLANKGKSALELAKTNHFDAITLSLALPDMPGWDLFQKIHSDSCNQDTPIFIISVARDKAASTGFMISDFLVKPVNPSRLLAALNRAGISTSNTVLIIDDDQSALKLASQVLTTKGYHVITETDGNNGLNIALKAHPAAIILDLLMPNMNGFQFLQTFRLTQFGKHIPIIVWTIKDLTNIDKEILRMSAQAVVKKDGKTDLLLRELQNQLPGKFK